MQTFTVKTALKTWTVTAWDSSDAIAWVQARKDRGGLVMWCRPA